MRAVVDASSGQVIQYQHYYPSGVRTTISDGLTSNPGEEDPYQYQSKQKARGITG